MMADQMEFNPVDKYGDDRNVLAKYKYMEERMGGSSEEVKIEATARALNCDTNMVRLNTYYYRSGKRVPK